MKKIIVTNIERSNASREISAINDDVFSVSAFWTLNNGLVIQVHYFRAEGLCNSYKSVSVSPFMGDTEKSYIEVRDGLKHVMDAIQAWVNRRNDRHEWSIRYEL